MKQMPGYFACFLDGPNVITLAGRAEGLFRDGDDGYLKKTSSMCLFSSQFLFDTEEAGDSFDTMCILSHSDLA